MGRKKTFSIFGTSMPICEPCGKPVSPRMLIDGKCPVCESAVTQGETCSRTMRRLIGQGVYPQPGQQDQVPQKKRSLPKPGMPICKPCGGKVVSSHMLTDGRPCPKCKSDVTQGETGSESTRTEPNTRLQKIIHA